jgi:uncharacterized protein YjbJ (UPF0337 family)
MAVMLNLTDSTDGFIFIPSKGFLILPPTIGPLHLTDAPVFSGMQVARYLSQQNTNTDGRSAAHELISARRIPMKSSTRDQLEGTFHEVKGRVREVVGKLSDNPKLQGSGTAERIGGIVQEKVGQFKRVLGK